MTTFAIGIVAHVARTEQANKLMADTGAVFTSLDNGNLGCGGNHRKVWRHLTEHCSADWLVVLEDDALPVAGFTDQLRAALTTAPAPVVSLYLGRLRPTSLQHMIQPAIVRADQQNAHWLVSRQLLHAVGLAIRADIVPDMLASLDEEAPIDDAIHGWVNQRHHRVGYTWPSLVEHADGETLLRHRDGHKREPGRVAWSTGTRDRWENRTVEMN
jgi:GR25 family glycosyltransferase involved in LPS biosynthesis